MPPTPSIKMPQNVNIALYVLYTYFAAGAATCFLVLPGMIEEHGFFPDVVYMAAFCVLGFSAGFFVEIGKDKEVVLAALTGKKAEDFTSCRVKFPILIAHDAQSNRSVTPS